jgi:probable F420-dependent oxidoreductase
VFELGVVLPNYGRGDLREQVLRVAEAAEELGFDSVWSTEHLLVGDEAAGMFSRILDSLTTLGWLAGRTQRIGLGTSVVILPLHNPMRLAKEAVTLQELSGRQLRLGVGVGWHEAEFDFFGIPFRGRGSRADEQIRLMHALWSGETEFHGRHWSFSGAHFAPLPDPRPELWVGGGSARSLRRARELGDVWHPNARDPEIVSRGLEAWPGGRIVPRVRAPSGDVAGWAAAYREAGAAGLVIRFGEDGADLDAMRRFARDVIGEGVAA